VTDYPAALEQAKKEGKLVLLSFGGSDWCEPCIFMKKKIFSSEAFKTYAAQNLVTVDLDFPTGKTLPKPLQKQNLDLAVKYGLTDPETGDIKTVPVLILLTPEGKQLAIEKRVFLIPAEFLAWAKAGAKRAAKSGS
jgi:thioredoxin-related protein